MEPINAEEDEVNPHPVNKHSPQKIKSRFFSLLPFRDKKSPPAEKIKIIR